MARIHIDAEQANALQQVAELTVELVKQGAAFTVFLKGGLWVFEVTGY